MVILDTSALIELVGGTEKGLKLKEKIENEKLATTSINVNEILITTKEKERVVFEELIETLNVLPFDKASSLKSVEIENELKKAGKMIGKLDLFIASICKVKDFSLATFDSDFSRIKGLKIIS